MSNTTHPLPPHGAKVLVWVDDEKTPRSAEYISNQWCVDGLESPGLIRAWMPAPKLSVGGEQIAAKELTDEEIDRMVLRIGPVGTYLLGPEKNHGEVIRLYQAKALRYLRDNGYLAHAAGLKEQQPGKVLTDEEDARKHKQNRCNKKFEYKVGQKFKTPSGIEMEIMSVDGDIAYAKHTKKPMWLTRIEYVSGCHLCVDDHLVTFKLIDPPLVAEAKEMVKLLHEYPEKFDKMGEHTLRNLHHWLFVAQ